MEQNDEAKVEEVKKKSPLWKNNERKKGKYRWKRKQSILV